MISTSSSGAIPSAFIPSAQWVNATATCGYDIPSIEALAALEAQR
jgi:hypothetical protein